MEEMLEKLLSELNGAIRVVFVGIGEEKLTDINILIWNFRF